MNLVHRHAVMFAAAALISAGIAASAGALTLEEALARVDEAYEVRVARSAVEAATRTLASLVHPGDASLSLDPGLKATTSVGAVFPEQLALTGTASLKLPVGLGEAAREKVEAARAALAVSEAALQATRASTWAAVYGLYHRAWLARTGIDVLELEAEAARAGAEASRRRYEAGEISLAELTAAEDRGYAAQEALLQGGLDQRLSWLSLVYATGQEKQPGETADAVLPAVGSLPPITDLVDWSHRNLQSVIEQRARVDAAAQALQVAQGSDLELDVRITGSYLAHSAAVSVDTATRQLSATYTFPLVSTGSPSGGAATWSLGLSAGISLGVGNGDRLAAEARRADLERETVRLESHLRTTELAIRSRYQQWLRAGDAMEQALRAVERARAVQATVEAKVELGQASEPDRLLAAAAVERALWSQARARVTAEEARLAAAESAGYLTELVGLGR